MSAPRPYDTYPLHQPALFTSYTMFNIPLYTKLFQLFLPCGICIVLKHCIFVTYACASPEPVISRISAILRSFCRLCGTYCYEIQRDTVIKTRHRSIAIWRWHSQRMNFRKGSGFKHTLIPPYHSRSTKRNILFKPLSNILRQRETTQ